ncbi:hypothetical protein ITP53_16460 [Nonomuraea sp. K274]|uniref:Uncharacterized protein n=1 Tax=Nonomuraea cypriaca TaxID=1187855 RepID=A0A931EYG7_9ACTN|nr:hypothetical protein [Nonomuraea cypriaca]MBF8187295.1 hypothetical protein [Nonomuraea cypriaca]
MERNLPSGRCPVPWCQNDHQATPGPHWQTIAEMDIDGATVELRFVQADLDLPGYVLVFYGPDWSVKDTLTIPRTAAVALGDVLALLTVNTVADFAAGLRRAAAGPHTRRSTQW